MASHKDTILELYRAFREGDIAAMTRVLDEDVVFHGPQTLGHSGDLRGRDIFFASHAETMTKLNRFETQTQAVVGDNDVAFGHNLITLRFRDGRVVQFHNVTSFRFNEQGQVKEAFEGSTGDWNALFPTE